MVESANQQTSRPARGARGADWSKRAVGFADVGQRRWGRIRGVLYDVSSIGAMYTTTDGPQWLAPKESSERARSRARDYTTLRRRPRSGGARPARLHCRDYVSHRACTGSLQFTIVPKKVTSSGGLLFGFPPPGGIPESTDGRHPMPPLAAWWRNR